LGSLSVSIDLVILVAVGVRVPALQNAQLIRN
jgi:hypothetical protein